MNSEPIHTLCLELASIVIPIARKLRNERRVGSNPFINAERGDHITQMFRGALDRLGNIRSNESWWKQLISNVAGKYTRPHFFEIRSVQEWIIDKQIRDDFCHLARARFLGTVYPQEVLTRIQEKYGLCTGEDTRRSNYAICVVLAVLHASIESELTPGERVVMATLRDKAIEDRNFQTELQSALDSTVLTEDSLHTNILEQEISEIVRRRGIQGIEITEQIERLVQRATKGDLARSSKRTQTQCLYWAARLLSSSTETIDRSRVYLEQYESSGYAEPEEIAFIRGCNYATEGNIESAVHLHSKIDRADARTSMLRLIAKRNGNSVALEWLYEQDIANADLLTDVGWNNAVVMLTEEDRWDDAIALVNTLPQQMIESFPELLFLKGMLYACLLFPTALRKRLLQHQPLDFDSHSHEGAAALHRKRMALGLFDQAKNKFLEVGAEGRAQGCEYHMSWLRLVLNTDKEDTAKKLAMKMNDPTYAMLTLDVALAFDIEFDRKPLDKYLRRRQLEGHLTPEEQLAQVRLLERFGTPQELLEYLQAEKNALARVFPHATVTALRIHAYIRDGRTGEAETELDEHEDGLPPEDVERHRLVIADEKGERLTELERLYSVTGNFEDLTNLTRYLWRTSQWQALLPHSLELLRIHRSAENLHRVIVAMQKSQRLDEEVLEVIQRHEDLVRPGTSYGDRIVIVKSFSLFNRGLFLEAASIATDVASRTHDPDAVSLEIDIALRTGQWEHFRGVIDREFGNAHMLPPELVLKMAEVVTLWDRDRAMVLASVAAERDPNNANVQLGAYCLATQIGKESEASQWIQRAVAISDAEEGPVTQLPLRELVAVMPSHASRRREWEAQLIGGELGIHPAASLLNMPIAQLLIGEPRRNEGEPDARCRSVIPIRHGAKVVEELQKMSSAAFDLTSLYVLEHVDLLDPLLDHLSEVVLPPNLMALLFYERHRVLFHQPSRVEQAKRIHGLIVDGTIRVLTHHAGDVKLAEEVGAELALLLHEARESGGRVVSTLPITKVRSLGEERAELGVYGEYVLKTTEFLGHLEPYISSEMYQRGIAFLESVDRGNPTGNAILQQRGLYIDNLALQYLDMCGLLPSLRNLKPKVFVHKVVNDECNSLIAAEWQGEELSRAIDNIRQKVRSMVLDGKVTFCRSSRPNVAQTPSLIMDALQNMLEYVPEHGVDVVVLDDRLVGKHKNMADEKGNTVPIVGSYDVMEFLYKQRLIFEDSVRTCKYRMMKGGFGLLPLDSSEIALALDAAKVSNHGDIVENRELMTIRQYVQRVRSVKMLRIPEEGPWFIQLANIARECLSQIWSDDEIAIKRAKVLSDWIMNSLSPLPVDWAFSVVSQDEDPTNMNKAIVVQYVLIGTGIRDEQRRIEYASWLEEKVVKYHLPANESVLEDISRDVSSLITKWSKEIAHG